MAFKGTMRALEQDMLWYVCQFLEINDLVSFSSTNKLLLDIIDSDSHWKCLLENRIDGFGEQRIMKLMSALRASSFRSLFTALWPNTLSIFGYFGKDYPLWERSWFSAELCTGGVIHIYEEHDCVMMVVLKRDEVQTYEIQCIDSKLLALTPDHDRAFWIKFSYENHILLVTEVAHQHWWWSWIMARQSSSGDEYYPVPRSNCALSCSKVADTAIACTLNKDPAYGVFEGIYGPHGREVISIRLVTKPVPVETEVHNVFLEGLKLTGDENVPAGKVSFSVPLSDESEVNLREMLQDAVVEVYINKDDHMSVNIPERLSVMSRAWKGEGTINRMPLVWMPESYEMVLVVYAGDGFHCATRNKTYRFSVLFMYGPVGHLIDFSSFEF